jgi:type II secretory pathway pseudopilin PulG
MAPQTTSPASAASCRSKPRGKKRGANPAPRAHADSTAPGKPHRAFTLVEMLIVIGIMILLITILLPVLSKVTRQAQRYKVGTLMNAISQGLEAYKGDFGDYPRLPFLSQTSAVPNYEQGDGFALLGVALMGPGPQDNLLTGSGSDSYINAVGTFNATTNYPAGSVVYTTEGTGSITTAGFYVCINEFGSNMDPLPSQYNSDGCWSWFPQWADGADGPGFRVRPGGNGRTWGPYLQADKIKMVGAAIVDSNNHPILYFARAPGSPNIYNYQLTSQGTLAAGGYVSAWSVGTTSTSSYPPPMYNASDNSQFLNQQATSTTSFNTGTVAWPMQALLGITATTFTAGSSSFVNTANGDSPKWTGPYILWSPGTAPTGLYGPNWTVNSGGYAGTTSYSDQQQLTNAITKCENVFNFSFAQ